MDRVVGLTLALLFLLIELPAHAQDDPEIDPRNGCPLANGSPLPPQVDVEINQTPELNDDYVNWAPLRARLKLHNAGASDLQVVLTSKPRDAAIENGVVAFAADQAPWPPFTTAADADLTLTLPMDAAWRSFAIAGEFPFASDNDKDAAIEIREGSASGTIIDRHCLMVRVRKNADSLTASERKRFLDAVVALHAAGGYYRFQRIHRIASAQAHKLLFDQNNATWFVAAPGFLPWHRAFVLEFERELQKIKPSVALPYWDLDAASQNIFTTAFMGRTVGPGQTLPEGTVEFDSANPLLSWSMPAGFPVPGSAIIRGSENDQSQASVDSAADSTVLAPSEYFETAAIVQPFNMQTWTQYITFFSSMELTSHDPAHGWVGGADGWMGSPATAVGDPVFFLLHGNVDRLWAAWQSTNSRFGGSPDHYGPVGSYPTDGSSPLAFKGHYLQDAMWPWDGDTGQGNQADNDPFNNRPTQDPAVVGDFPSPAPFALGPSAHPKPAELLDYMGASDPTKGLGYAYDEIEFPAPALLAVATAGGGEGSQPGSPNVEEARATVLDRTAADADRIAALKVAGALPDAELLHGFAEIIRDRDNGGADFRRALVRRLIVTNEFLAGRHHAGETALPEVTEALRAALTDSDPQVSGLAAKNLAINRDAKALPLLIAAIKEKGVVSRATAVRLLGSYPLESNLDLVRPLLADPEPDTRAAAIMFLEKDSASQSYILDVLRDRDQPEGVRLTALRALQPAATGVTAATLDIVRDTAETESLRAVGIQKLGTALRTGNLREVAPAQIENTFKNLTNDPSAAIRSKAMEFATE